MKKTIVLLVLLSLLAGCAKGADRPSESLKNPSASNEITLPSSSEAADPVPASDAAAQSPEEQADIPDIDSLKPGTYEIGNMTFEPLPEGWRYVMGTSGEHWLYSPASEGPAFIQLTYEPLEGTFSDSEIQEIQQDSKNFSDQMADVLMEDGSMRKTGPAREKTMLGRPLYCYPIEYDKEGKWLDGFLAIRTDEKGILVAVQINYKRHAADLDMLTDLLGTFSYR